MNRKQQSAGSEEQRESASFLERNRKRKRDARAEGGTRERLVQLTIQKNAVAAQAGKCE